MSVMQINGYIGGIRDEFVLEAEPRALAALTPKDGVILSSPAGRSRRTAKRWIPLIVAAAIAVTVGLNLGLTAGMNALLGQGGAVFPSGPSYNPSENPLGSLIGGLFPFLRPDETDTDPEQDTEAEPPRETRPVETHPCAAGHTFTETELRPVSCYAVSRSHGVCSVCGHEEDLFGEETLPHTYVDGFCTVCGLVEGSIDWKHCLVLPYPSPTQGEVTGYGLENIHWNSNSGYEGEVILPNVFFTEEFGLLPVTALWSTVMWHNELVTKVVIPDTVTVIGAEAFMGCTALAEVNLPEGLTAINNRAFAECSSLTELVIPDSVTELDDAVFGECSSLTRIVFPAQVDSFGKNMLVNCTALTEVVLPENLTELPYWTFAGCHSLTGVTLPETLTAMGEGCFLECRSLTAISLPDGITTIGREAFSLCKKMTEVKLPAALTAIPDSLFIDCIGIKELVIPEGVTEIGIRALQGTGIRYLTIPAAVTDIKQAAFYESNLREVTFAEGSRLRALGKQAFYGCQFLTYIDLPEGTLTVEDDAFKGCKAMEYARIPNTVTAMGNSVFESCEKLESVVLPTGLEKLGNTVFDCCYALTTLEMDGEGRHFTAEGNCLIELETKELWYGIATSVIPEGSVVSIRRSAFQYVNIRELAIPEGVERIGISAFADCDRLVSITLPSTLREIGQSAFSGCRALTEVAIPEGVTVAESFLFSNCTSLHKLTLPGSLTEISSMLFTHNMGEADELFEIHFGANVAKWQKLIRGEQLNLSVWTTVYCQDGMIDGKGNVTYYDKESGGE